MTTWIPVENDVHAMIKYMCIPYMSKCNDSECNSRCAYLIRQSAMTQVAIIQLQVCTMSLEPLCNIPHIAWIMLQVRKCNMWE